MTAMPTRIEPDLYDAAKTVGSTMSRSAAQQINHWARIGRELEAAQGLSSRDIEAVLAGRASYDTLNVRDQAVVRAEWDERIADAQHSLDLEAEFTETDQDWVEADTEGNTVLREPTVVAKSTRQRRTR
jgi:hypothetical protein